jgi:hypothetical protein
MNSILQGVINGGEMGKGLFLMVAGILFVFLVQVLFYAFIKLWPKKKTS